MLSTRISSLALLCLAVASMGGCDVGELGANDPDVVAPSNGSQGSSLYRITIGSESTGTATSDTGTPTTDSGYDEGSDDELSESDLAACGEWFDGKTDFVHVTGNQQLVELSPSDALVVKVTGNRNEVVVTVESAPKAPGVTKKGTGTTTTGTKGGTTTGTKTTGTKGGTTTTKGTGTTTKAVDFDGICFILRGNQATATTDLVDIAMGTFALDARGNQPLATLDVDAKSSVDDVVATIRGNQGTLIITGDGSYPCPKGDVNGNDPQIICK